MRILDRATFSSVRHIYKYYYFFFTIIMVVILNLTNNRPHLVLFRRFALRISAYASKNITPPPERNYETNYIQSSFLYFILAVVHLISCPSRYISIFI